MPPGRRGRRPGPLAAGGCQPDGECGCRQGEASRGRARARMPVPTGTVRIKVRGRRLRRESPPCRARRGRSASAATSVAGGAAAAGRAGRRGCAREGRADAGPAPEPTPRGCRRARGPPAKFGVPIERRVDCLDQLLRQIGHCSSSEGPARDRASGRGCRAVEVRVLAAPRLVQRQRSE